MPKTAETTTNGGKNNAYNATDSNSNSNATDRDSGGAVMGTLRATYFTGTHGAGGRLYAGCIALNNTQRRAWGISYGSTVYLDFPVSWNGMDGYYTVMDTGCSSGIVDIWYSNYNNMPSAFRSAGVIQGVKISK